MPFDWATPTLPRTSTKPVWDCAAGRDVGLGGPVLRGSVRPSLALVWGSGGRSADSPTRVFGRVGAELRLLLPFTRELRGVVALDGELAPSLLGEPSSRGGNNGDATSTDTRPEPTYPAYTVGLGLGVELAIR
jgi:hypothetical protein